MDEGLGVYGLGVMGSRLSNIGSWDLSRTL